MFETLLFRRAAGAVVAAMLCAGAASAQWKTQSIPLVPGWNAVHLEVDPVDRDADALLAGVSVESVWMWNKRFNAIAFLTDPEDLLPEDPNWLVWFPPSSPQAGVKTLYGLKGGESFLVKLGGTSPVTLSLTGTPVAQSQTWSTDSFNLVGFQVDGGSPPTVGAFFATAPQHRGNESVFRLSPTGRWSELSAGATMRPGEALWVYSRGPSSFNGPFEVVGSNARLMDYNRNAEVLSFDLSNRSGQERVYTFSLRPSAQPPTREEPAVFGPVQLSFFEFDQGEGSFGSYVPMDPTAELRIPAGGTRQVRLAVRRVEMGPIPEDQFATFQSLLSINDNAGTEVVVPVRAFALNQTLALLNPAEVARKRAAGLKANINANPFEGLWVGSARIENVNFPANLPERNRPVPSGGAFEFRVIVHVDDAGTPRLVQQVTMMSKSMGGESREIVLVTDDARLGQYEGVIDRGGATIGQRISSTNFPFFNLAGEPRHTLPSFGGAFEDGDKATTDTLRFRVTVPFDDPLNPFMHAFHPDHDNRDANFQRFPEGSADIDGDSIPDVRYQDVTNEESYSIVRDITLAFTGVEPGRDPAELNPGWLAGRVGGLWREEIYGLYRTDYGRQPAPITTPLITTGTFSLVRVSGVAKLNDGVN